MTETNLKKEGLRIKMNEFFGDIILFIILFIALCGIVLICLDYLPYIFF